VQARKGHKRHVDSDLAEDVLASQAQDEHEMATSGGFLGVAFAMNIVKLASGGALQLNEVWCNAADFLPSAIQS